jgi:hypothetical protein
MNLHKILSIETLLIMEFVSKTLNDLNYCVSFVIFLKLKIKNLKNVHGPFD